MFKKVLMLSMAAYKAMNNGSLVARVVEPSKEELEGFNTLTNILDWSRIDGSPLIVGKRFPPFGCHRCRCGY